MRVTRIPTYSLIVPVGHLRCGTQESCGAIPILASGTAVRRAAP